MTDWTIHITARADHDTPATIDVDQLERLVDELAEHGGVTAGGDDLYAATFTVAADNAVDATSVGVGTFRRAAARARLPEFPIVRVETETIAETDAELARPAPRLVGISEIAEILGVTRQRASMLQTREGFPAPAAILKSGPVWMLRDIDTFRAAWTRKPGRPPKHVENDPAAVEQMKGPRQDVDPKLARLAGKE